MPNVEGIMLKKIWDVEIDLLEKLKEICRNNNLNYCACCGTLLGAVRHGGFIPWDDDIDVFLMWDDYKKLMQLAPLECKYPYFFQGIYSEKDALPGACRLRRSDTTGFTLYEYRNVGPEYDKGIFIDIFPLFNVPNEEKRRNEQKKNVMGTWECIRGYDALNQRKRGGYVNREYDGYIPAFFEYCEREGVRDIEKFDITILKEKYLEACASEKNPTIEVGATSSKCHDPKLMWLSEWYESYIELPFENTTIRCPLKYEKILEKQYGNWRVPVKGRAAHEMAAIDVDIPWREYDMSSI